ncbi:uncharacterized protein LTR77_007852 [Saxophila tyrrhenica]|uniref:Uncharacterized protein n=1 Tax=Saxophila tyrrhenica TaxID=1690608 RepID=A0AAV9P676_9PEZI|nr:hypothetical protein LTR77_007852 [Saxophila tyrrhenica]
MFHHRPQVEDWQFPSGPLGNCIVTKERINALFSEVELAAFEAALLNPTPSPVPSREMMLPDNARLVSDEEVLAMANDLFHAAPEWMRVVVDSPDADTPAAPAATFDTTMDDADSPTIVEQDPVVDLVQYFNQQPLPQQSGSASSSPDPVGDVFNGINASQHQHSQDYSGNQASEVNAFQLQRPQQSLEKVTNEINPSQPPYDPFTKFADEISAFERQRAQLREYVGLSPQDEGKGRAVFDPGLSSLAYLLPARQPLPQSHGRTLHSGPPKPTKPKPRPELQDPAGRQRQSKKKL